MCWLAVSGQVCEEWEWLKRLLSRLLLRAANQTLARALHSWTRYAVSIPHLLQLPSTPNARIL